MQHVNKNLRNYKQWHPSGKLKKELAGIKARQHSCDMQQRIPGSKDTVKFFRAHSFIKVALQSAVCHTAYYFAHTAVHANTYCNQSLIWFKVSKKKRVSALKKTLLLQNINYIQQLYRYIHIYLHIYTYMPNLSSYIQKFYSLHFIKCTALYSHM